MELVLWDKVLAPAEALASAVDRVTYKGEGMGVGDKPPTHLRSPSHRMGRNRNKETSRN